MLDAARVPDAAPEQLRALATSEYSFVRAAVARHPATGPDVLAALVPPRLTGAVEADVASALAKNPRSPASALSVIAALVLPQLGEPRAAPWAIGLGIALCCHPATPADAVRALLTSPRAAREFRKVAARESRRADALALLSVDRSEKVRRAAERSARESGERREAGDTSS